jgi:hypothetical protein
MVKGRLFGGYRTENRKPRMLVIFLDESGDLGFEKPGSSKKFIVTLLVCFSIDAAKRMRKAVERTLRNKLRRKKSSSPGELKGSHTHPGVLEYFFRQLPKRDWALYAVILNKQRVFEYLRAKQARKKLYNYLARFVIEQVKIQETHPDRILLVVDRSKKFADILDFNRYLETYLEAVIPMEVPVDIQHEDSAGEKGLQVVDVFSNCIFRKHEKGEERLYRQFEEFIKFETVFLP